VTKARAHLLMTRLAGVGLVLALFASCGDDGSVTAPPTPAPPTSAPPTPAPSTLLIHGEKALEAPPKGKTWTGNWDFTTTEAGTVEVTISYLHDDSQILVWVTDRQCNKWQFERDECFYLTKSLAGARPRTLKAEGVAKGTYSLFVANDGPHDEQIGYEVRLTPRPSGSGR
jgi:hypothetical protein